MTDWSAIGPGPKGARAFAMRGDRVMRSTCERDEAKALTALAHDTDRVIRIGEGVPARLPAPVLPEGGHSLPGWDQHNPPDVIGGWVRLWTAGFLHRNPGWDGVICAVDGGVSHWIHISASEAVSAQSFLTPRLIGVLGGAGAPDSQALADSLSRPERLAAHLRVAEVTGNRAAIAGHLIGAELAAAKPYWLGQQVAVIARQDPGYAGALVAQGVPCEGHDSAVLEPHGLAALAGALGLAGHSP